TGRDPHELLATRGSLCPFCGAFIDSRKVNLKNCSHSFFAVNPNVPTTLLHDPVHGRQSKPRPFTDFLRGEEWFEDPRLRFLVHAVSRIANRQQYVVSRLHGNMA